MSVKVYAKCPHCGQKGQLQRAELMALQTCFNCGQNGLMIPETSTRRAVRTACQLALIGLMPLKTVVPYTLLVDRSTGFVEVLDGTHPQVIKPDAALVQAMLRAADDSPWPTASA